MSSSVETTNQQCKSAGETWDLELFHDGACPLCAREVAMLRRLDRDGRIGFVDISNEGFDAAAVGMEQSALDAEIHARLPDGSWIRGVEVFRRLYAAVGFRRLVGLSRWPLISQALDLGYKIFAKNRLRLTGRCDASGKVCRVRPRASGGEGSRTES